MRNVILQIFSRGTDYFLHKTIKCLGETNYIAFIPGLAKIFTSNLTSGSIQIYDIKENTAKGNANFINNKETEIKARYVIDAASEFVNDFPVTAKLYRTGTDSIQLEVKK